MKRVQTVKKDFLGFLLFFSTVRRCRGNECLVVAPGTKNSVKIAYLRKGGCDFVAIRKSALSIDAQWEIITREEEKLLSFDSCQNVQGEDRVTDCTCTENNRPS